jgi:cytosine/adenosine deaminase-related metal-dependent hydrolase
LELESIMSGPRTLTARWVFPVSGPPLEGGTVTVRGDRIEAVEPRGTRTADEDLGNVAVVPGLVNAHAHLDLSGARGLIPPTDPDHFTDWLRGVIAYRRTRTPEQTQADIRAGLAECLRSGTTLIGDIAAEGQSWGALAEALTRAVVYYEIIGVTEDRAAETRINLIRWDSHTREGTDCRKGVSPHAPYSVQGPLFKSWASAGRPLATHLAESPAELELIRDNSGPFEPFLREFGVWMPDLLAPSLEAIIRRTRHAPAVALAHCNYLPPNADIRSNQSIVYCPRTHAAFGHPPHPFREFLARGVRVCLGTDSLASNPDLDVLAEAKLVRERYPDFPGDALLRMVTLSGAEALGWAGEAGSLEPGKSADLVALPLPDRDAADPHELLFASIGERRTMFRGEWR